MFVAGHGVTLVAIAVFPVKRPVSHTRAVVAHSSECHNFGRSSRYAMGPLPRPVQQPCKRGFPLNHRSYSKSWCMSEWKMSSNFFGTCARECVFVVFQVKIKSPCFQIPWNLKAL